MRSLFLKIFLWFWVTVVLIALAWVITWNLQPELIVSRWRASMGEAISIYAQSATEEIDRYGQNGLSKYLQRLDSSAHIRAALFDDQGQYIAGVQSNALAEAATHAPSGDEPEFEIHPGTAVASQRATGPSGRTYIFVAEMPRGPVGAFRPNTNRQLQRLFLAVVISGIICYLLTRYLTRPIFRLRTAARELASGNLSARADSRMERRRDEFGELVRDFNLMAERIEAVLISQRQLISDISHELRSPLARLSVALGLARQRAGASAAGALDRIEREAERLNELIGKLLTLARMQAANQPPEGMDVDLQELLAEVAADASFEAQEHNRTARVVSSHACHTQGSPELLRSAVENVVRNAVRYTAEHTEVELSLNCSGDGAGQHWAEITVRDHGPGVPEAELANMFRPFYRIASARERQTGGVGLGLAIADRAVQLHGGSVQAKNLPGGGLQVQIRLPARA